MEVNKTLSILYAEAKTNTTLAVRNIMDEFPLPVFMYESILESILLDIRNESKMELSLDYKKFKDEIEKLHKKEKEELIAGFEEQSEAEIDDGR